MARRQKKEPGQSCCCLWMIFLILPVFLGLMYSDPKKPFSFLIPLIPIIIGIVIFIIAYRVNITDDIFRAIRENDISNTIRILKRDSSLLTSRDEDTGYSPFCFAVHACKSPEMLKALLKYGADVNACSKNGSTPLHIASERNHITMKFLIKSGAKVNIKDNKEKTPLDLAIEKHYLSGIVILLNNGADWTISENEAEDLLFESARQGHKNMTLILVRRGINVNIRDDQGKTPLHHCTNRRNAAIILVESGALLDVQDNLGNTPLHYATNKNTAKFLVKRGADIRIKNNEGKTAFDIIGNPVN